MNRELWFNRIINIVLNTSMGGIFTFFVLSRSGTVSLEAFILSFIPSFCIGYVFADLIPLQKVGDTVAKKCKCRNGSVAHFLVKVCAIAFVMTTGISFFCTLLGVGFHGFFSVWISSYPILLLIGCLVEIVFLPLSIYLATLLTAPKKQQEKSKI